MQRQAVLHAQVKAGQASVDSRTDYWINLAVAICVGCVQFGLKPPRVKQHIGSYSGQRAKNVVRGEKTVSCHRNTPEFSLDDLDANKPVSEFLLRKRDADGGKAKIAIEQLVVVFPGLPQFRQRDGLSCIIRQNAIDHRLRQRGVALQNVSTHGEGRGGRVGPGPVCKRARNFCQ